MSASVGLILALTEKMLTLFLMAKNASLYNVCINESVLLLGSETRIEIAELLAIAKGALIKNKVAHSSKKTLFFIEKKICYRAHLFI